LLNGLLFSLPGTPVVYYGDEIGMGDNVFLGDRNGVRTPMQWSTDRNAGFSRANPQRLILPIIIDPEYHYESLNVEAQQNNPSSLLWWTKRLIALRKRFQAFGRGTIEFLNPSNARVLAFVRRYQGETILVVANLSRFVQFAELDLLQDKGRIPVELFGGTEFPRITDAPYLLTLGGHAFYWFSLEEPKTAVDDARVSNYAPEVLECASVESLLHGADQSLLNQVLPSFLRARRWFGGRDRHITAAPIVECIPLGKPGSAIALARVEYAEGEAETYALPLLAVTDDVEVRAVHLPQAVVAYFHLKGGGTGVLLDALEEGTGAHLFLESIASRRRFKGPRGEVLALPQSALAIDGLGEPRNISADHHDASVQYDDRYILKVFRRIEEGLSPELEVGKFLEERTGTAGFTPRIAGHLEYRAPRTIPITLGVLQHYVPNEGTAWQFTREELRRFYERVLTRGGTELPPAPDPSVLELASQQPPPLLRDMIGPYRESAALLGRRTAGLHLALASSLDDPAFTPEPYAAAD
ncbi:MAG: alpha-glucosidase C-terminal domain-containing protein, partial [Polyangiaceae bacterium]